MAKKKTLKYWKTKIDKPFHEYIRRLNVNSEGYGTCISCDKGIHFSESDAGHFISRGKLATRWSNYYKTQGRYSKSQSQNTKRYLRSIEIYLKS